ncbi:hypothetical protein [Priestia megaterium]|uniref:hypothetical protein n=1 Tax=Priestia megaterium TaxID=1404 RepID=UPI00300A1460
MQLEAKDVRTLYYRVGVLRGTNEILGINEELDPRYLQAKKWLEKREKETRVQ